MKQKRTKLAIAAARITTTPKAARKMEQSLRDTLSPAKITLPTPPWEKDDKTLDKAGKV